MTMSVVTSVGTVGSKKPPPRGGVLAAGDHLGALLDGVGNMRLDLLDSLHVDQRADHGTRLEPVGDLHRTCGLGEALGEGIVDAVLHQVRLAQTQVWPAFLYFEAMAPLPPQGQALDRSLDIGVVEDDERRAAANYQRKLLDRAGALLHQQFADPGDN
jgi:hypothetical protein